MLEAKQQVQAVAPKTGEATLLDPWRDNIMTPSAAALVGVYDPRLVVLSILIAVIAAGATIDLAGRVTDTHGKARLAWLTGGAFGMGMGIWAMHYIGMLAFELPVKVLYHWPTVLFSLLASVVGSWASLFVASRLTMTRTSIAIGCVVMGSGISAMHYIGMEAMCLPAMCQYSTPLVVLSIVLAMVIAYVALSLTFSLRGTVRWSWRKVAAALAMGGAIPIQHYVGMAAVTFLPTPFAPQDLHYAVSISDLGTLSITLVTLVILGLVFVTSTIDRRFTQQARALASSEHRYRLIVETAADAFLEIDPQGRLTGWNAHAEHTFGWSRSEAIGQPIGAMLVLTYGDDTTRSLRQIFDSRESAMERERIEVTARHRDGHEFPVEMNLAMINVDDRTSFAAFVHDVTARKLAEQERENAKSAAEAGSRAKSEFLANMSHEIRTPMNGVIGMTELLLDTGLDALQRDYAETIRDSSAALLTIINDILDFSKVEAGKVELEHLDMDVRDLVEDVTRLLSVQANAKGFNVTRHIDARLPIAVNGDPGRLRQVLLNLGGNAVKFTTHGAVSLEVSVIETGARGTKVRCEVRDTGIGIPAHRLPSLFAPFTQADTSTTRKFGGTGLGLSIVKKLVELMGGETGIESTENVGSTFWFTAWFGSSVGRQVPAPTLTSLWGKRVLAVDDNATDLKVLMGQLQLCGMQPKTANCAREALSLLRKAHADGKPFEVALVDHRMPDCDGAELGLIVVADDALKFTRLVLVTSSGRHSDRKLFEDIGYAGYLLKPIAQRELSDCLTLVLAAPAEAWHMKSQPIITQSALQTQRQPARARILLAEDNDVNQKVAVRLLEKLGYRVDIASDGKAAVAAWKVGGYELVLMDCQMPELDGYAATRNIRELELADTSTAARRTPIIALTADAVQGTEETCRAAGMDGYLSKPIDRVLLQTTIARLLERVALPPI